MKPATRNPQLATPRGFTLVELMISLALVLILILGINYVFRSAADAVGAGTVTNQINADAQSAQPLVFDDLRNATKNPPCFIISSQLVTQFLNQADANGNTDPNVMPLSTSASQNVTSGSTTGNYAYIGTTPAQPSYITSVPMQWVSPAYLNNRNHRCDLLEFFAHGLYARRSGPDGTYLASDMSHDAFIEFGHAALPSNDLSAFYGPSSLPVASSGYVPYNTGAVTTGVPRTGGYAADWVLARRITLLKDPNTIPPWPTNPPTNPSISNTIDPYYTAASATFPFQYAPQGTSPSAFAVNMAPLSYGTPDTNGGATQFQSSRYDMAGITPEEFDRIIANAILGWQVPPAPRNPYSGSSLWWNPLVYSLQLSQSSVSATPPQSYQMTTTASSNAIPPYVIPYTNITPVYTGFSVGTYDPGVWYARPQCNPTIQNPVTAASIAEMAPYFLQHCSQFVVEYAGDYMQQNATGDMTGLGPDGQIDYYVDGNGNKHIRWYGMPRSTTGAPHLDGLGTNSTNMVLIRGYDPKTDNTNIAKLLNYFTDVIPLRDYYTMWFDTQNAGNPAAGTTLYAPPWEVDVNFDPTHDYGSYSPSHIATAYAPLKGNDNAFNNPVNPPRYVAAWHDDMPAMIRILIKVDDTNNKVKDGPWYEYVFRLK